MRWLAILIVLGTACSSQPSETDAIAEPAPLGTVTGIITELRFDGRQLQSFDLETHEGTYEILIDPERDYGFNLRHLEQHRGRELPVLVETETRNGANYAISIFDA
jgi:hypothetical protein